MAMNMRRAGAAKPFPGGTVDERNNITYRLPGRSLAGR